MKPIVLHCDRTTKILSSIQTVLGSDLTTISLRIRKGLCRISAQSKDVSIALDTPAEGEGEFGLYASTLRHMLQGRNVLNMSLNSKKSQLEFYEEGSKTNSYKGSISTVPYLKINVDNPDDKAHYISWASGMIQHFDQARKLLALKDMVNAGSGSEQLSIRVKEGKMICGSYDKVHMGIYSTVVDIRDAMSFSIPFDVLKRVMALIDMSREDPRFKAEENEQDMEMAVDSGSLYLKAFNMRASLRMVQADVKPFDIAIDLLLKCHEQISSECIISGAHLRGFTENILSINEQGQPLKILFAGCENSNGAAVEKSKGPRKRKKEKKAKDKKQNGDGTEATSIMTCEYSTAYGHMTEKFEGKNAKGPETEIHVLPETIQDFMRLIPAGDIRMAFCSPDNRNYPMLVIDGYNRQLGYMTPGISPRK